MRYSEKLITMQRIIHELSYIRYEVIFKNVNNMKNILNINVNLIILIPECKKKSSVSSMIENLLL